MNIEPSRREKREAKLYSVAEKGRFQTEMKLYKRESDTLAKRDGFKTFRRIPNNKSKPIPTYIDWQTPFPNGVPPIAFSYINGETETFPEVSNWAQELFVIAARANNQKVGQKTNE